MRLGIIPQEFTKKGVRFRLVERNVTGCVYSRELGGILEGYEVFRHKTGKPHPMATEQCAKYDRIEKYPCDEEFGRRAWTYKDLDPAMEKYRSLHGKNLSGNGKPGTEGAN